ncbi:MAG TPA: apolipoprotein N-acyltransferase, partial [Kiritimatiellia bacterium]|jgi:apolipoprotein N-acyltransferase|nr:apolipoprotein N-acyltransferase [Kiritimatiellia bacterium]
MWAAFPPQAQVHGMWMALAPLFLVIRRSRPREAFGWSWLCGMLFWLLTLSWFPAIIRNNGPWFLVLLGQGALAAWCALFLAMTGAASARVWGWAGQTPGWRRVATVAVFDPLLWVGAEVVRGWLFSGFAWNFLGVSQVDNTALIQVASITGVYGVSALLVMGNGAVASLLERMAEPFVARCRPVPRTTVPAYGWAGRFARSIESFLPLVVVLAVWFWGMGRIRVWDREARRSGVYRIALIQPNAPCIFEVSDETVRMQWEQLVSQSRLVGAAKPDLVVWPETAVMGSVPYDTDTMRVIREGATAANAPLLTGALEVERAGVSRVTPDGCRYYNAAWLVSATGETLGCYRKRHLVPFGEYIPGDKLVPWLQRFAPTGVSCTPGRGPGPLHVARGAGRILSLGPLICFEDTIPALSRGAVRAGARLLVLMTNDAWFSGSVEPLQHQQQAVFRAVENGVPLVRAANSGVSCVVDAVGRVKRLESGEAITDFDGFLVMPVTVPEVPLRAPYTAWGDWVLGIPGAVLLATLLVVGAVRDRRARRREEDAE